MKNKQHEELTQKYSTWGDKLLQHTDVLHAIQSEGEFRPITIQLAPCEACFTGDTKVSLLDGTEKTLIELSERIDPFWVFSYDTDKKKIVPGKAVQSRLTRKNAHILSIELDNGEIIKCTDDHKFLLKNQTYVEAKNLTSDMSLMPLYRRSSTEKDDSTTIGYPMALDPLTEEWFFVHRRVSEEIKLQTFSYSSGSFSVIEKTKNHSVRHHIDHNKNNNDPSNLAWMTFNEHRKFHQDFQRQLVEKNMHPFQVWTKTEEHRTRSSLFMKNEMVDYKREHGIPLITKEIQQLGLVASNKACRELGELGLHNSQIRVREGTHHFQQEEFKQNTRERNKLLVAEGKLNLQSIEHREKVSQTQNNLLENGTHYFKSEKHKKSSSERMKIIREYQRFLFENKFTKEEFPFSKWKAKFPSNHKIVAITDAGFEDVYCLEIEQFHNFALTSGVFVRNCDSDCPFCSVANRPLKSFMPINDIEKLLVDFKTLGAKSVEITGGGNPMLYRDRQAGADINDIINIANNLGYNVGIITNSEKLSRLKPETHSKLDWVRISLIKLDEGIEPEDYDFAGFPYEKLGFSYIIYDECGSSPIRGKHYEGTSEKTIEKIAKLVELHQGMIKFVRFAGNCLIKGNNALVRKKFGDIVDANDRYKKFFLKVIENDDGPFNDGCYVGAIRPYVAPKPHEPGKYMVYVCTSHVLNTRTYDLDYALCEASGVIDAWKKMGESYRANGYPYEVKCNKGRDWEKTCKFCYYHFNNKLLHTVAQEMPDKNFP